MRSVSLRDGGEVVAHERVRTKIIRFGSGYPQKTKIAPLRKVWKMRVTFTMGLLC